MGGGENGLALRVGLKECEGRGKICLSLDHGP